MEALQLRPDQGTATSVTNSPLTIAFGVLCFSLGSRVRGNDGGLALGSPVRGNDGVFAGMTVTCRYQPRKLVFVRRSASFQPAMSRMRSLCDMSGS